ncbi:hypothetical protein BJ742DRAFT_27806 [Cladochytrium replicatum]|nr:hypothetical protein BJ742DRAFT_27806 [Cladochytrium replicatum]
MEVLRFDFVSLRIDGILKVRDRQILEAIAWLRSDLVNEELRCGHFSLGPSKLSSVHETQDRSPTTTEEHSLRSIKSTSVPYFHQSCTPLRTQGPSNSTYIRVLGRCPITSPDLIQKWTHNPPLFCITTTIPSSPSYFHHQLKFARPPLPLEPVVELLEPREMAAPGAGAATVQILDNVWTQGNNAAVSFFTSETFSSQLYAEFRLRQEGAPATNVVLCKGAFYTGTIGCPDGVGNCKQAVCTFTVDRGQAPAANYFVEVDYQDCVNILSLPASCKAKKTANSPGAVTIQRAGATAASSVPPRTATTVLLTTAATTATTTTTTTTATRRTTTTISESASASASSTAASDAEANGKTSDFPIGAAVGVGAALLILVIAAAGFAFWRRHQSKRTNQKSDLRQNFFGAPKKPSDGNGKYNQFEMDDKPLPVPNKVAAWKPVEEAEGAAAMEASGAGYYAYPATAAAPQLGPYMYPAAAQSPPNQGVPYYVAPTQGQFPPQDQYYASYPAAYVVDPYGGPTAAPVVTAPATQQYMYTYAVPADQTNTMSSSATYVDHQNVVSPGAMIVPPAPAITVPPTAVPPPPQQMAGMPAIVPPPRMDVPQQQ